MEKAYEETKQKLEELQIVEKGDFSKYEICRRTIDTLNKNDIKYLFPIQQNTYNEIYCGKNVIARDRTGSGKTLAFVLPILERLRKNKKFKNRETNSPLLICIVPTRELAIQITNVLKNLENFQNEYRVVNIYGGVPFYEQIKDLKRGVEFVIGTPGRILDLLKKEILKLRDLEVFVLDETDQMLDIGFQDDIEKIMTHCKTDLKNNSRNFSQLQFLLFSATLPNWIDEITSKFIKEHVRIEMIKKFEVKTSKTVQHYSIHFPDPNQKITSISDVVSVYGGTHSRTIIFTDTKQEANDILLKSKLKIESQVLHGDIPQSQREITFKSFREGQIKCLIATNVAARGLDIPKVDLIIQISPPKEIDTYIHRSGRTGRANKKGICITFFTNEEKEDLDKISYKAKIKIKRVNIPQVKDILQASAKDVEQSFDEVNEDVLPLFREIALDIFTRYDHKEALCRALAIITGYTTVFNTKSLLSGSENFLTFILKSDRISVMNDFWKVIKQYFNNNILMGIRNNKFLKMKQGVLFELKKELKEEILLLAKELEKFDIFCFLAKDIDLEQVEDNSKKEFSTQNQPHFSTQFNFNKLKLDNLNTETTTKNESIFGKANINLLKTKNDTELTTEKKGENLPKEDNKFKRRGLNLFQSNEQKPSQNNFYSNNTNNNKENKKIFLSNLNFQVTEQELEEIIKKKGYVDFKLKILKHKDGNSKGVAIIEFFDKEGARYAFDDLKKLKIKGRSVNVNYADY